MHSLIEDAKKDFGFVKGVLTNFVSSKAGKISCAAVAAVGFASTSMAADPISIPVIGVSVQEYISAAITLMGTVAGTAVGGYAAFLVVRKGLRWLGRALG